MLSFSAYDLNTQLSFREKRHRGGKRAINKEMTSGDRAMLRPAARTSADW
jgi:hypothetical protein